MANYISRKNSLYGSLRPDVTRVFITHGSVDPWHRMGILTALNTQTPVAIIPGASHCNDLSAINFQKDTKEMLYTKVTIRNLVKSWLNLWGEGEDTIYAPAHAHEAHFSIATKDIL